MPAFTNKFPHLLNWIYSHTPKSHLDYWIITLFHQCCFYMIWPPGHLPSPTSCLSLMEDFRGGALGGSLMFNV